MATSNLAQRSLALVVATTLATSPLSQAAVRHTASATSPATRAASDIILRDQMYLHTQEARKRAVVASWMMGAYNTISYSPYYQAHPDEAQNVMKEAAERGRAEASLDKWSGGWAEIGARGASGMFFGGTAMLTAELPPVAVAVGVAGASADQSITKMFADRDKDIEARAGRNFSDAEIFALNVQFDLFLKSKFKDLAEGVDEGPYKTPPEADPAIKLAHMSERIDNTPASVQAVMDKTDDRNQKLISGFAQAIKDGTVSKEEYDVLKKELTKQIGALTDQAQQAITSLQSLANEQMEEKNRAADRSKVTAPFAMASNLAIIFRDKKTAFVFSQASELGGTLYDISKLTKKQFKDNPAACVNLYLTAFNIAVSMMAGAQENQEFAATMSALRQISEQIIQLGEQMQARFDQLDVKVDNYFFQNFLLLDSITASQEAISSAVQNLHQEMGDLRSKIDFGFSLNARRNFLNLDSKCDGGTRKNTRLPIRSEEDANACFSQMIGYGLGLYSDIDNEKENGFDRDSFVKLVDVVSSFTGNRINPNPPSQFISATSYLAQTLKANPTYIPIAQSHVWADGRGDVSLDNLVATGEALDNFHTTMALQPRRSFLTGSALSGYRLRKEIIDSLAAKYYELSQELSKGVSTIEQRDMGLLDVGLKWQKDMGKLSIPFEQYPFSKETIGMCSGVGLRVLSYNYDAQAWEHDERSRRITAFSPADFHVSDKFLQFLPASVRWANYLQTAGGNRVYPCFRRADIEELTVDIPNHRNIVRIGFGIDFLIETASDKKTYKIAHVDGSHQDITDLFDPRWSPGLLRSAWTGEPVEKGFDNSERYGLMNGPNGAGFKNNPEFLIPSPGPDVQADLQAFEKKFGDELDSYKDDLLHKVMAEYPGIVRDMNSIRWQVSYLLQQGIDMNNFRAVELHRLLLSDYLPEPMQVAGEIIDKSPTKYGSVIETKAQQLHRDLLAYEQYSEFKPAISAFKPYVNVLTGYKNPQPGMWDKVRGFWSHVLGR